MLKKRFGNTQLIVNRHMDALLRLTAVTTHHDVKELQWLCDAIGANVKGFVVRPKPDQPDRLARPYASSKAYAAVIYLQREVNNNASVTVVATKMCVTPIISVSIPRLDLLSLPLPDFQVTVSCPFEHTGVDFARPTVCQGKSRCGGMAVLLHTTRCTTHAVHLNLVENLNADSFMWSLSDMPRFWRVVTI